jgi:hypothetical protein
MVLTVAGKIMKGFVFKWVVNGMEDFEMLLTSRSKIYRLNPWAIQALPEPQRTVLLTFSGFATTKESILSLRLGFPLFLTSVFQHIWGHLLNGSRKKICQPYYTLVLFTNP